MALAKGRNNGRGRSGRSARSRFRGKTTLAFAGACSARNRQGVTPPALLSRWTVVRLQWIGRGIIGRCNNCSFHGGIIAHSFSVLSSEFCRFWWVSENIYLGLPVPDEFKDCFVAKAPRKDVVRRLKVAHEFKDCFVVSLLAKTWKAGGRGGSTRPHPNPLPPGGGRGNKKEEVVGNHRKRHGWGACRGNDDNKVLNLSTH